MDHTPSARRPPEQRRSATSIIFYPVGVEGWGGGSGVRCFSSNWLTCRWPGIFLWCSSTVRLLSIQLSLSLFQAVFSVTIPSPEIYLVAKVEKILQGGISTCAEPYMRAGENAKVCVLLEKLKKSVIYCMCLVRNFTNSPIFHGYIRSYQ